MNTPVGVNFLLGGYAYTEGDLATSGSSPLQDAELDAGFCLITRDNHVLERGVAVLVDSLIVSETPGVKQW